MDVYRKYSYGDEVTVVEGQYSGMKGQYVHPTHAIVLADGTVIHVDPWDLCGAEAAVDTTSNLDSPLKQQEVGDSVHIETGNYHGQTGTTDSLMRKRGTNKRSRNE